MSINTYFQILISLTNELYLVGGSVRDYLLKVDCYDYDFVIKNNTISIGKELANKTKGSFFILDHERETIRVVWNIEGKLFNFDIAKIIGENIINDLELRDLTINSIAININNENYQSIINHKPIDLKYYIDPSNGLIDLKNNVIQTYKKTNLSDDPLRMLRAFRFSTKFNFKISSNTLETIKNAHIKIKNIAKERVLKELYDMLAFNISNESFKLMFESGLFFSIFDNFIFNQDDISDNIKQLELLLENLEYNFQSYKEIKYYLQNIIILNRTNLQCLKFALIFRQLKNINLSNDNYLLELEKYLRIFTFSALEQRFIINTVKHLLNLEYINNINLSRTELYLFFKYTKNETISILLLSYIFSEEKEKIKEVLEYYINDKLLSNPPDIINGSQIMEYFNLKPSKNIGILLEKIKQAQAEKLISNYEEAIFFIKKLIN
ncbi:MAG: hypothetical protein U0354_11780 [Candidatus Sericytochromatia bacterium]